MAMSGFGNDLSFSSCVAHYWKFSKQKINEISIFIIKNLMNSSKSKDSEN